VEVGGTTVSARTTGVAVAGEQPVRRQIQTRSNVIFLIGFGGTFYSIFVFSV
jgi:hypothetical protein